MLFTISFSESNTCVCQDHWDWSHYLDSCANQQGCTDCDGSDRPWCATIDDECGEVERNSNGTSRGWFWCNEGI